MGSIPSAVSLRTEVRYQQRPWSCGAAALVNAGRVLGVRFSERTVRRLCGMTEDGTDEFGIISAARELGLTTAPLETANPLSAFSVVHSNVVAGRPTILCVDNNSHWVCVSSAAGERVGLVDSANTRRNKSENGVHFLGRRELLRRWKCRLNGMHYAIVVGRK